MTGENYSRKLGQQEKKDVLIRGVDREAYDELLGLAKRLNTNLGTLASDAFRLFVSLVEDQGTVVLIPLEVARKTGSRLVPKFVRKFKPILIRHVSYVKLSRRDLEECESPLILTNIDELVFGDDVTEELFDKKILKIIRCNRVVVPSSIRKFVVLSKTLYVGEVIVKNGEKS